jgi:hypothetical protein
MIAYSMFGCIGLMYDLIETRAGVGSVTLAV